MAEDKKTKEEETAAEENGDVAQTISLFLAIGFIIGALIVGLVIGYVVAPKGSGLGETGATSSENAPALTPEQVESGKLPPGHPQLPAPGSTGTTENNATGTPATNQQ